MRANAQWRLLCMCVEEIALHISKHLNSKSKLSRSQKVHFYALGRIALYRERGLSHVVKAGLYLVLILTLIIIIDINNSFMSF